MKVFRFSLRLPSELHKRADAEVKIRQTADPGASLNSLICEALGKHMDEKEAERKASAK